MIRASWPPVKCIRSWKQSRFCCVTSAISCDDWGSQASSAETQWKIYDLGPRRKFSGGGTGSKAPLVFTSSFLAFHQTLIPHFPPPHYSSFWSFQGATTGKCPSLLSAGARRCNVLLFPDSATPKPIFWLSRSHTHIPSLHQAVASGCFPQNVTTMDSNTSPCYRTAWAAEGCEDLSFRKLSWTTSTSYQWKPVPTCLRCMVVYVEKTRALADFSPKWKYDLISCLTAFKNWPVIDSVEYVVNWSDIIVKTPCLE